LRAKRRKNKNSIIRRAVLKIIIIDKDPANSKRRIFIVMKMLTKTGIWRMVEVSTRKQARVFDV